MKPIQVHIENFQSIETLDFTIYGFTCITGKSNIGKSAIARAIYRCLMNEPVKGSVRHGKKFVTVSLSSDWNIWWKKGEKGNEYEVNQKSYSNTGQKQLQAIADLGFRSVRVGDQDITPWYANQYEPVFLLNKSGGQITEFISEISRLKVVQESIQKSIVLKKKANDRTTHHKDEITRISKRLSSFIGIEDALESYKALESAKKEVDQQRSLLNSLIPLQSKIQKTEATFLTSSKIKKVSVQELPVSFSSWESSSAILKKIEASSEKLGKVSLVNAVQIPDDDFSKEIRVLTISETISKLKKTHPEVHIPDGKVDIERLQKATNLLKLFRKIRIGDNPPEIPEIKVSAQKLDQARQMSAKLDSDRKEIRELEEKLRSSTEELESVQRELSSFSVCPFCESHISGSPCSVPESVAPSTKPIPESQQKKHVSISLDDFDF